jgi:hypothetical protein
MQLNTPILREVSFQISAGNPWWGMLIANEYLQGSDYLRRALVTRFLARITPDERSNTLARSLVEGRRAYQLPEDLRNQVGSRSVRIERPVSFSEDRYARRRGYLGLRRSGTVRRRTTAPLFAPREVAANARRSE